MDLRATVGYETFKGDGMRLFIETATGPEADFSQKMAADVQTLLEMAWGQKNMSGGAMMLCRLVGYLEGLGGVVAAIHGAGGVRFVAVEDEEGKPTGMRVVLHPDEAPAKPRKPRPSAADLDKLEGLEFEEALARMTDAERENYLAAR